MDSHSLLQGISPTQGLNPGPPTLQEDSLPSEPQGKPKNSGVGSLFVLEGIFPTQESNQGLLPCRLIVYQLNYQGSPKDVMRDIIKVVDLIIFLKISLDKQFKQ